METKNYIDPWTGIDRKEHKKAWRNLLFLFLLSPLQFLAIGYGVYMGFTTGEGTALFFALVFTIVVMVVKGLLYEKASDVCDRISWDTNAKMWANVEKNLVERYGEGKVVPYTDEPRKITPPDGATGFWAAIDKLVVPAKLPVVWTTETGEHLPKNLSTAPKTFEPELTERKTSKSKKGKTSKSKK